MPVGREALPRFGSDFARALGEQSLRTRPPGRRTAGALACPGGRRAFLIELDPLYCDVIAQRFEKFAGQKVGTGRLTSDSGLSGADTVSRSRFHDGVPYPANRR